MITYQHMIVAMPNYSDPDTIDVEVQFKMSGPRHVLRKLRDIVTALTYERKLGQTGKVPPNDFRPRKVTPELTASRDDGYLGTDAYSLNIAVGIEPIQWPEAHAEATRFVKETLEPKLRQFAESLEAPLDTLIRALNFMIQDLSESGKSGRPLSKTCHLAMLLLDALEVALSWSEQRRHSLRRILLDEEQAE